MTGLNVVNGIPLLTDAEGELAGYKDANGDERGILSCQASGVHRGTIVLAQSAVASSHTGDTAETTLASITIPGGTMGENGAIRVSGGYSHTSSLNAKTITIKLGGTTIAEAIVSTNATASALAVCCGNRNSQVSQHTRIDGYAESATINTETAIDTSVDQVLTITGTLATATETIALEGYTVEVLAS